MFIYFIKIMGAGEAEFVAACIQHTYPPKPGMKLVANVNGINNCIAVTGSGFTNAHFPRGARAFPFIFHAEVKINRRKEVVEVVKKHPFIDYLVLPHISFTKVVDAECVDMDAGFYWVTLKTWICFMEAPVEDTPGYVRIDSDNGYAALSFNSPDRSPPLSGYKIPHYFRVDELRHSVSQNDALMERFFKARDFDNMLDCVNKVSL